MDHGAAILDILSDHIISALPLPLIQCFNQKILLQGQSGPWKPKILGAKFIRKGPINWKLQKEKMHQGTKENKAVY